MTDKTLAASKPRCPVRPGGILDDARHCGRELGHDGLHRLPSGLQWSDTGRYISTTPDPDDMDGGVAAGLIEEEAHGHDYTPCTHETDSSWWQDRWKEAADQRDEARRWLQETEALLDKERSRAIKAERELSDAREAINALFVDGADSDRDLAHLRRALDLPNTATTDEMVARIEEINAAGWIVTDAMVKRARAAEERLTGDVTSKEGMHTILTAALTPEPAEDPEVLAIADVLGDFAIADEHSGDRDDIVLARRLHERGIRKTEDGAA